MLFPHYLANSTGTLPLPSLTEISGLPRVFEVAVGLFITGFVRESTLHLFSAPGGSTKHCLKERPIISFALRHFKAIMM
ncbi:unnamed protein product [Leptosia nina]|uniref:Uncharacterized protein n=1 Tax=Leptosia nina TaxID=320188 RepID=A0AAV1K3J8_9NEOP